MMECTFICLVLSVTLSISGTFGTDAFQNRRILSVTTDPGSTIESTTGSGVASNTTSAPEVIQNAEPTTVWEKIVAFYTDKNNMAMYLVLPCIVFVYGGCCLIYCIAKCRRYCKKKRKKPPKEPLMADTDDSCEKDRPRTPRNKVVPSKPTTPTSIHVSVKQDNTEVLPCEVPSKKLTPTKSPPPPYDAGVRQRQVDETTAFGGPTKPAYPYQRGTPNAHGFNRRDDPAARNAEMKAYFMARQFLNFDDCPGERGKKQRLIFTAN